MSLFAREPRSYTNERMAQDGTVSHEEATGASDNPWLPIDTMPLSTVGTEVDVREDRRLHSGVTVSGIRYEREVLVERYLGAEDRVVMGEIDAFTITVTHGSIHLTLDAEWRPHG